MLLLAGTSVMVSIMLCIVAYFSPQVITARLTRDDLWIL